MNSEKEEKEILTKTWRVKYKSFKEGGLPKLYLKKEKKNLKHWEYLRTDEVKDLVKNLFIEYEMQLLHK